MIFVILPGIENRSDRIVILNLLSTETMHSTPESLDICLLTRTPCRDLWKSCTFYRMNTSINIING